MILLEIAIDAGQRFGHRNDAESLVKSTVETARELLTRRPKVTDFIGEIALANSRAQFGAAD